MHLADAFIQSDLHCIQVTVFTFYQLLLSLGIEPMILALLMPCSTIWATGKLLSLKEPWEINLPEKAINSQGGSHRHVMTIHAMQLFTTDYSCTSNMYSQYLRHFTKHKHYTSMKGSKHITKLNIHRATGPIGVSIKYKTAGLSGWIRAS